MNSLGVVLDIESCGDIWKLLWVLLGLMGLVVFVLEFYGGFWKVKFYEIIFSDLNFRLILRVIRVLLGGLFRFIFEI